MLPTININKIVEDLLPVVHKFKYYLNNNLYQLILSLVKPSKNLYSDFLTYESDAEYELLHNGQVLSLEHQLNDYYNFPFPIDTNVSIWLDEGVYIDQLYIFNNGSDADSDLNDPQIYVFNNDESLETIFEENYIYTNTEVDNDTYDFVVNYPDSITDTDYITSIVNKYKLGGYSYILDSYYS